MTWHVLALLSVAWMLAEARAQPPQDSPQIAAGPGAGLSLLEALRSTLERQPLIQSQEQQVAASRAITQQFRGSFDVVVSGSISRERVNTPLTRADRILSRQAGMPRDNTVSHQTTLESDATKLLRSGILVGVKLELTRAKTDLPDDHGVSRGRLSFDVNVPLLRGRGAHAVAARETAAAIEVQASLFELNQVIAERLFETVVRYWDYLASIETLHVLAGAEARGRRYVEVVQTLIDADRLPRNEIHQAQANLTQREAERITSAQAVSDALQSLALAMGLAPEQMLTLPPPADAFPSEVSQAPPAVSLPAIQGYLREALQRRADYLAAMTRIEAAQVRRVAARNQLLPQVDVQLSTGYAGLAEGESPGRFPSAAVNRLHGPDVLVGLRGSFPPANNVARGLVAEAEAVYRQAQLNSLEVSRNISAVVSASATGMANALAALQEARDAVLLFQKALDGERDKLRLGVGSLTNILTVEDRLTNALASLVNVQRAYAVALARFRFATGTIIAPAAAVHALDQETFLTLSLQERVPR